MRAVLLHNDHIGFNPIGRCRQLQGRSHKLVATRFAAESLILIDFAIWIALALSYAMIKQLADSGMICLTGFGTTPLPAC